MKKHFEKTLIVALLLALVGCGASANNTNDEKTLLEQIKEEGVLIVATSPDYPPYEFIDPSKDGDEKYVGADIEVAKYIAEELGVELELLIAEYDAALASVSHKKAHLVIAAVAYKEDRLEAMDFTHTYNPTKEDSTGYQGVLVLKEDADKYQTLDDFKDKKVGAQMGSLQEEYVKTQLIGSQLEHVSSYNTAIMLLQKGKVDGIAMPSVAGEQYSKTHDDIQMSGVKFIGESTDLYDGTVIGVQKNNPEFLAKLNEIVAKLVQSKQFDEWEEYYKDYSEKIGV